MSAFDRISPSAAKPTQVVEQWRSRFPGLQFVRPAPASLEELCLAHDPEYVRRVLACEAANGFGTRDPEVAASLCWTNGSLLSAARWVLEHGGAACSPTCGFHHAGYDFGGSFCTFNGLMVAALAVERRVGILDCDHHYGNGTEDIRRRLGGERVRHHTTGTWVDTPPLMEFEDPEAPERFLRELPGILRGFEAELLLYQAGADAHVEDPMGGWMSSAQMRRRDRIVFETCRSLELPVVWNLAGGYQRDFQKVLDLHHATMEECLAVYSI